MNTTHCPLCDTLVTASTRVCPRCHTRIPRPTPPALIWIGWGLIAVVGVPLLVCGGLLLARLLFGI